MSLLRWHQVQLTNPQFHLTLTLTLLTVQFFLSLPIDPTIHPGELSISGKYASKLSSDPLLICAGISALASMKLFKIRFVGFLLSLQKGLPLGSSLGSSTLFTIAGAATVNALFRSMPSIAPASPCRARIRIKGFRLPHTDNIAPAIMGGFVLIRSYQPLDLMKMEFPETSERNFELVSLEFEAPTERMSVALPKNILWEWWWNGPATGEEEAEE